VAARLDDNPVADGPAAHGPGEEPAVDDMELYVGETVLPLGQTIDSVGVYEMHIRPVKGSSPGTLKLRAQTQ
jgi:hypothetical protein